MKKIISAIIIICIITIGFIAYKSMAKPTVKANAATLTNNSSSSNTQKTDTSNGDNTSSSINTNTSTGANTGNNFSTNTTTNNGQSQSATTSNSSSSSNGGSGQNSGSNNQGRDTSSSTSTTTTNSKTSATSTQKLIPSRIEYLNLAVPFGDPTHLLAEPNSNASLIPNTSLSGIVKIKILGLVPDESYFYIDFNGVKGFITSSLLLALANNYLNNLNTANVSKPNPTDTFKYTIRIPNNVVINAYETPYMNTSPVLQLKNTDRGTCTFLICNYGGNKFAATNSAEIFYNNQILYVNRNYLMDYCLQPIKISDFTS